MNKRKGLSARTRFEVFKRDSFKCQYCGRSAPDVALHVDHLEPWSTSHDDSPMNLITACVGCNAGKGATQLSDARVVQRQKKQLDDLNERREQLRLMARWKRELLGIEAETISAVVERWGEIAVGWTLNEQGRTEAACLLRKYSFVELLDAVEISARYIHVENGKATQESVDNAWHKIAGICYLTRAKKEKPYLKDVFMLRALLRKRLNYINEWEVKKLLIAALEHATEMEVEAVRSLCFEARSYNGWVSRIEESINEKRQA